MAGIIGIPGRLRSESVAGFARNPRPTSSESATSEEPKEKSTIREDQRDAVSALCFVSGKTVTVRKDGRYGNTMIDYRDTLPADLAPMVIMDASGRVRDTYASMEEGRGNLVRLRSAVKDYSPLTVNVWTTAGSKSAFERQGPRLVEGVAKTIATKPTERWLVVHHKKDRKVGDVREMIEAALPPEVRANVRFLTWGQHIATNEYADVPNVVLAGTLFYRPSYYEALKRLSAARRANAVITKPEMAATIQGEHLHLILQALCRGRVRRCDGERCLPMNAYVIASAPSRIAEAIAQCFPGCRVVPWKPIVKTLKGRVREAVDYLAKRIEEGVTYISYGDMQAAMGMDKQNACHLRRHPDLIDATAELGLELATPAKGKKLAVGWKLIEDQPTLSEVVEAFAAE